jgi:SpoVK/Ycf46/Vps4 family AAA+-type ATPase
MRLYNKIKEAYKNTAVNLFTLTGNIYDITMYKEGATQKVASINKVLKEKLEENNHVVYFTPSVGMKYTNKEHLEEFYAIDSDLKEIHSKAFSLDYAQTKYDILSGLHMIKVLLASYRKMRKKYGASKVKNLVVLIDDADIIFPNQPIEQMGSSEKLALSLAREMLGNSEFTASTDSVILLSSTLMAIHEGVRSISGLYSIVEPLPNKELRDNFIRYENAIFDKGLDSKQMEKISQQSAGIPLFTLQSILKQDADRIELHIKDEVARIIEKNLGSHVKVLYPKYGFDKVIGYDALKLKAKRLIKRMDTKSPWKAIAYIGATGTGKDFQTEAFLYEANIPVIKLQNIKSKWYGETAVILEKIKMVARSFEKIIIFKPEADKLFPDPESKDAHQTDQEMSAIFLDWMSDNSDRGQIFWVFNTSRPQMFPVDFQRRIEIKLPIFDLEGDERKSFIELMLKVKNVELDESNKNNILDELVVYTDGFSSDNIRMIADELAAELEIEPNLDIIEIIKDLNFDIVKTQRQKQSEYAASFSTYKSLIPKSFKR